MKVILNSDILFTRKLISKSLPMHLQKLASECARMDAVIILPRTALLEVERHQRQLMETEISSLEKAFAALRSAGVGFEEKEASSLFGLPDVSRLFRAVGARVEIEEPGIEDFEDAQSTCVPAFSSPSAGHRIRRDERFGDLGDSTQTRES